MTGAIYTYLHEHHGSVSHKTNAIARTFKIGNAYIGGFTKYKIWIII